jgi:hypothetical protein
MSNTVAVLVYGEADAAKRTLRDLGEHPGGTVYLVLETTAPCEFLNRTAFQRHDSFLFFLQAGLVPVKPDWWKTLLAPCLADDSVGAAVGTNTSDADQPLAGLLTRRDLFETLGGLDADRQPMTGFLEEFLARLIGQGHECRAPAVDFRQAAG